MTLDALLFLTSKHNMLIYLDLVNQYNLTAALIKIANMYTPKKASERVILSE